MLAELRQSNAELKKTLGQPGDCRRFPDDTAAAMARVKELVSIRSSRRRSPNLDADHGTRSTACFGTTDTDLATSIENLRQITDNLRDLTEDTKRYPANVIFGAPPRPFERKR